MSQPDSMLYRVKTVLLPHEQELLAQTKKMYSDFIATTADGEPREVHVPGKYWSINYRVMRRENGQPLIEKEIYYNTPDSSVRVADTEGNSGPNQGLERVRGYIEEAGMLTAFRESGLPLPGDVKRIELACGQIAVFHRGELGRRTENRINHDHGTSSPHDEVEVAVWASETQNASYAQFGEAYTRMLKEGQVLLPPADDGRFRFENNAPLRIEVQAPQRPEANNPQIKWGDSSSNSNEGNHPLIKWGNTTESS